MQKKSAENQIIENNNNNKKYQFTAEKVIGNGTFGVVYEAKIVETGEKVAIKKVYQDKRYKNRELEIIQLLNHPNCLQLKHAFYTTQESNKVFLNLVTDFLPENLYKITKMYFKKKQQFPMLFLKLYSYQMFRAIAYLHGIGICHRDMKPQNVLIDPQTHLLKLCDFGSAKKLIKGEQNISYICSRYYRAPELIFGATQYTTQIDIWSTACVIAESVLGQPLFPGESAVDQLVEILKILGTPTIEEIKQMNPQSKKFNLPNIKQQPWNQVFPKNTDKLFLDFISKLLVYIPEQRYIAIETLTHPFFDELRTSGLEVHQNLDLFNFTTEELSLKPEIKSQLVPQWYQQKKQHNTQNGVP